MISSEMRTKWIEIFPDLDIDYYSDHDAKSMLENVELANRALEDARGYAAGLQISLTVFEGSNFINTENFFKGEIRLISGMLRDYYNLGLSKNDDKA